MNSKFRGSERQDTIMKSLLWYHRRILFSWTAIHMSLYLDKTMFNLSNICGSELFSRAKNTEACRENDGTLTFDLPHAVSLILNNHCQDNKRSKNSHSDPEQFILQPAGVELQSKQCQPFYNHTQYSTAAMSVLLWTSVCERESSCYHPSVPNVWHRFKTKGPLTHLVKCKFLQSCGHSVLPTSSFVVHPLSPGNYYPA